MKVADERSERFERYKLAHAEYRAEVALGWDRQKLFLTLNPAVTALVGVAAQSHALVARAAFVAAALTALAGALVVRRSHTRYQAARAVLQRLEDELGISDLQTTGGMRAAREMPRLERFRVIDVVVGVFVLYALLDLLAALVWV